MFAEFSEGEKPERKQWTEEETAKINQRFKEYIELPPPSTKLPREYLTILNYILRIKHIIQTI